MIRAALTIASAAAVFALAGCYVVPGAERPELSSFDVKVLGIYLPPANNERAPAPVVSTCQKKYAGEKNVPAQVRGTPECPYAIPRGNVEIDVEVTALKSGAEKLTTFNGPISFRVVPGDLTGDYPTRTVQLKEGTGKATLLAAHMYSEVRVWAEDAPPKLTFEDGKLPDGKWTEPADRTWATGLSDALHFEDPTIAKVQIPDGNDNKTSPFVGQFLTIGRPPENGGLKQSCTDDPANDGQNALLVVTGTDPTGFFVTDITACRQKEASDVRVPEPDKFQPGTYGSMFIYNYSFPEGLDQGDVLWSIAGAVQEFGGTTQLTFPSWIVAEHVRSLPEKDWKKWLDLVPVREVNLRTCGLDNKPDPFVTDTLCAYSNANMKMESLESALVKVKNVRFTNAFAQCDFDGSGEVPMFCQTRDEQGQWLFGTCPGGATESELKEIECAVQCVTGQGEYAGKVCTELSTYNTFGQYNLELAGPGPAEAGLDPSLPQRLEEIAISSTSKQAPRSWGPGTEIRLYCDAPVRVKFGNDQVTASGADQALPANTRLDHLFIEGESQVAVVADGVPPANAKCIVAQNPNTRISVVTKDAIPELKPNCNPDDRDAEAARQCRNFRGATYDLTGHLRQVQAARPRWMILPRDKDDLCCHPGPGLECPAPIRTCP